VSEVVGGRRWNVGGERERRVKSEEERESFFFFFFFFLINGLTHDTLEACGQVPHKILLNSITHAN
jgi:hypothetical protein